MNKRTNTYTTQILRIPPLRAPTKIEKRKKREKKIGM